MIRQSMGFRSAEISSDREFRLLFRKDQIRLGWWLSLLIGCSGVVIFFLPPPGDAIMFFTGPGLVLAVFGFSIFKRFQRAKVLMRSGVMGYRVSSSGIREIGGRGRRVARGRTLTADHAGSTILALVDPARDEAPQWLDAIKLLPAPRFKEWKKGVRKFVVLRMAMFTDVDDLKGYFAAASS